MKKRNAMKNKKNRIKKYNVLIVIMCSFLLTTSCQREAEIFELEEAGSLYLSNNGSLLVYDRHFMMTNAPEDLTELKEEVDEFLLEYFVDFDAVREIGENYKNVNENGIDETLVELHFYRERRGFRKDRKTDDGYFSVDKIEFHNEDMIASVYWTNQDEEKKIYIYKSAKDKDNYGDVMERIIYYEDEIKHTIYLEDGTEQVTYLEVEDDE